MIHLKRLSAGLLVTAIVVSFVILGNYCGKYYPDVVNFVWIAGVLLPPIYILGWVFIGETK